MPLKAENRRRARPVPCSRLRYHLALLLLALSLMSVPETTQARTWYIKPDATGDAPTVQAGVDSALAGDTVLVAAGSYTWTTQGGVDLGWSGPTMVIIQTSGITLASESGPATTILHAEGQGRVILCYVVSDVVIDGFSIRGGIATAAEPTAVPRGSGAGILSGGSAVTIRNNVISGNHALFLGGGIELDHPSTSPPVVAFNVIHSNSAGIRGSAIETHAKTNTMIMNNTIVGNIGNCVGFLGDSCLVANNIIANTAAYVGNPGRAFYCPSTNPFVQCNDVWNNAGGDTICGVDGGGNFLADPQFCMIDPIAASDFRIRSDSPCAPENSDGCDLIGAIPVGCDTVPSGIAGEVPVPSVVLFQNVPNPFNPATVIDYQVTVASALRLEIYDVEGRRVRTLVNRRSPQPPGIYQAFWDGNMDSGVPAPSGVYFYRLDTGGIADTRKMVLLR